MSNSNDDVLELDEIELTDIDDHPATESVLLHGPPGTGKTTESAGRTARLFRDHGYEVADLAWGTYRTSLAQDTLDRFGQWGVIDDRELDEPTKGATRFIGTIHAIANRCVSGLPQPIEDWRPKQFCKKLGISYSTEQPWERSPGKDLFKYFQWMAENCLDPADPSQQAQYPHIDDLRSQFAGDLGEMWKAWEKYKQQVDRIDYHEQLQAVLEQGATPGTDILVIDEYHDATPLIARVVELWRQDAEIVIIAGDPHQVVNQYQGADPWFFERLKQECPKILLKKSWRVGEGHWRPATRLLAQAHDPPAVEPSGGGIIRRYRSSTFSLSDHHGWRTPPADEAGSPPSLARQYDDVMFLTRTRSMADGVAAALEQEGILYASQDELGGWNTSQGETRLHLYNALTKLQGVSPGDFDDGTVGLGHFEPGWGGRSPARIVLSFHEAATLLRHVQAKHLTLSGDERRELADTIRKAETPVSLADLDEHVTSKFWGVYTHGAGSEPELIQGDRSGAQVDRRREALRAALLAHDRPINPRDINASVLTIHASKGQEAEDVVLYDGITSRIKRGMRLDEATRKNEWRTWYVGFTRASERLHVVRDAFQWGDPIIPNLAEISGHAGYAGGETV